MRFPRLFGLLLLGLAFGRTAAQAPCGDRYLDDLFGSVTETSDLVYGQNINVAGVPETLTLDVYTPDGDTAARRKLIVLAHGGFFFTGSKDDADIDGLCEAFARKGYVCASINYRKGWTGLIPDSVQMGRALIRAVQDAKAAVRWFRQDAATANVWRVDTGAIVAGGSSAGGFTALHLAFLRDVGALPAWAADLIDDLGGLEGESGNPGYGSRVQAVLNFAGAMVDTAWMTGGAPVFSTHSTDDDVVPYGVGTVAFFGFNIIDVMGSGAVTPKADAMGLDAELLTFTSAGHVPHISGSGAFDQTVGASTAFLYRQWCPEAATGLPVVALDAPTVRVWSGGMEAAHPDAVRFWLHDAAGRRVAGGTARARWRVDGLPAGWYHVAALDARGRAGGRAVWVP